MPWVTVSLWRMSSTITADSPSSLTQNLPTKEASGLTKQRILKKQVYFISLKYKSKIKHWIYLTGDVDVGLYVEIYIAFVHLFPWPHICSYYRSTAKKDANEGVWTDSLCTCKRPGIPSFLYFFRTGMTERCPYMRCSWIFERLSGLSLRYNQALRSLTYKSQLTEKEGTLCDFNQMLFNWFSFP